MSIIVTVELQAQADKVEDLKGTLKAVLPDTRAFDGCEGVDSRSNLDDPANIVLIETWASRGHYEKYFQWRLDNGLMEALGPLVAAAPVIKFLDAFDA